MMRIHPPLAHAIVVMGALLVAAPPAHCQRAQVPTSRLPVRKTPVVVDSLLSRSVMKLVALSTAGETVAVGNGVAIGKSSVLTHTSLLDSASAIFAVWNGRPYPASRRIEDQRSQLVVVDVPGANLDSAVLGRSIPRPGQAVTLRTQIGDSGVSTLARVQSVRRYAGDMNLAVLGVGLHEDGLGAGIFGANGELVALAFSAEANGAAVTFGLPTLPAVRLLAPVTVARAALEPSVIPGRQGPPPGLGSCDQLAGHPDDPGRRGAGVPDSVVQVEMAIIACENALDEPVRSGRTHFQLGRSYWLSSRIDDALEEFLAADSLGYIPASYYLGLLHELGLVEGVKAPLEQAKGYYLLAHLSGFAPASEGYAELVAAMETVEYGSLQKPDLARAVVEGDTAILIGTDPERRKSQAQELAMYLRGIHDYLAFDPSSLPADSEERTLVDPACLALASPDTDRLLTRVIRVAILGLRAESSSPMGDLMDLSSRSQSKDIFEVLNETLRNAQRNAYLVSVREAGTDDAYLLSSESGGCGGDRTKKLYGNAQQLVSRLASQYQ